MAEDNLNPLWESNDSKWSLEELTKSNTSDLVGMTNLDPMSESLKSVGDVGDLGFWDRYFGTGEGADTEAGSGLSNIGKGVGAFTDLYGLYAGSKALGMSKDRLRMAQDNSLFSHQMDLGGLMAGITDQNAKKAFFGNENTQSITDYIPLETLQKYNMGHLIGNNAPQSDYIQPIPTGYEPLQPMGEKTQPYSLANPSTRGPEGGSLFGDNVQRTEPYKLGGQGMDPNTSMLNKTPQTGFMPLGEKRRGY